MFLLKCTNPKFLRNPLKIVDFLLHRVILEVQKWPYEVKNPQFWVDFYKILDLCILVDMYNFTSYKKNCSPKFWKFWSKISKFWKILAKIFRSWIFVLIEMATFATTSPHWGNTARQKRFSRLSYWSSVNGSTKW